MPGNSPQAPRVGRNPHHIAQMGRQAQRESAVTPTRPPFQGCSLISPRPPISQEGAHGDERANSSCLQRVARLMTPVGTCVQHFLKKLALVPPGSSGSAPQH